MFGGSRYRRRLVDGTVTGHVYELRHLPSKLWGTGR